MLLLLEKLLLGKYIRRLPAVFQHLYAMVIVIIGWVFFASPDLSTALAYLQVMFSFSPGTMGGASLVMPWLGMAVIGVVAATPLAKNLWEKLQGKKAMPLVEGALCLAALLLCTASLVSDSYNPFLLFPVLRGGTYCEKIVFLFAGADLPGISGGHGPSAAVLPGAGLLGE